MESPVCGAPVGWNGVPNARAEGPADQRQPPESGWPALNTVLSERWFGQARFTQRLERGFVLQHEGRSAAPSARSGGLDDIDGGQHGRLVDMTALRLVFGGAPASPRLGRRGHIDLNLGIGTDDGADIAAIEHGSRRLGGKFALEGE